MMEEITLKAIKREEIRKGLQLLRKKGYIPCVIYGAREKGALSLKIEKKEFLRLLHTHRLESSIFSLLIEDEKKTTKKEVMIKEIQYHPVTGDILHLDFHTISLKKSVKVKVPLITKGEPIGIKQQGGVLDRLYWELEVECLPTEIPKEIEVDISNLKIGDSICVKDLKIAEGVKILEAPETILFTVSAPKEEVVEVKVEAGEERAEPEVIKKEKKEEEEAE
jgi:large subunit ribosomal protein L25